MQRLEVSCAVRHIYKSLGAKGLIAIQPRDAATSPRNFYSTTTHSSNIRRFPHIHVHNELTVYCLSLSWVLQQNQKMRTINIHKNVCFSR